MWASDSAFAYVITTNGTVKKDGTLVMGAGIARQAREMFPGLDVALGQIVKERGNTPVVCKGALDGDESGLSIVLITMPTKHNYFEDSDIKLIEESANRLMELADLHGISDIAMPRPGCGNGKLDWETQVKPVLSEILDDRFVVYDGATVTPEAREGL